MGTMTPTEARDKLKEIEDCRGDDEMAHNLEDAFRREVLRAIADGSPHSQELASIALQTGKIDFTRWCA